MTSSKARIGALAAILLTLMVAMAVPAAASVSSTESTPIAQKTSGGAPKWLMIGSGLLLGVGIGGALTLLRKDSSK
ncbi:MULTISPECIES: hypothetical protein [Thermomonospora]|uniref:Gram-positive cocci surface proteins LPxTG domain-containing protein n=1 Tax=Thermomonospora curvata (strain ATCC 19995 / DSM 43183 / JCM 3096 / KCTC 9072 / NBRC 15933 / NCIMB 10081 / Henssen B9) TaxID=471852 RepID=D1A929_THECD|nr:MULTISPECIES: hypothetical protein [Thermomonospora]ACY98667.1 hypothetical protein Tcur_3125 [Thermomonospora curvata DSM 43183]PKK13792.1 MAG: hypothetical protein BUE48_015235 [Thermomonospora sp. CIF 1]